jgi:hypothetical protein
MEIELQRARDVSIPHDFAERAKAVYSKEIVDYFSFLLRQPPSSVESWYTSLSEAQQGELHETLKHTVGRCALCHNPSGGKHLMLRSLVVLAGAVCPNPLPWLPSIDWSRGQKDVLSMDADYNQERQLLSLLIGSDGLFTRLFVHKTSGKATILKAQIEQRSLTFTLNVDMSSFVAVNMGGVACGKTTSAFVCVRDFLKAVNSPCCLVVESCLSQMTIKHGE